MEYEEFNTLPQFRQDRIESDFMDYCEQQNYTEAEDIEMARHGFMAGVEAAISALRR